MNEKFENAVKDCIIPILSRFTNGITELKIEVKKSFNGKEYYDVETNNIPMTPCVFKTLCIQGTGKIFTNEDGNESIAWSFNWRWTHFDGGENGTQMISFITDASLHYGRLNMGYISF